MRTTPLLALIPLAIYTGCAPEGEVLAPVLQDTEAYLDQEILISIDNWSDEGARVAVEDSFGLTRLESIDVIKVGRYALPDGLSVKEAVSRIGADERVAFAEPNYLVRASANDPYLSYQWNLAQIGVEQAWGYGTGLGVTVAVLDTGVRTGAPDGIGRVASGYDFYNNDSDTTDGNGHGTFVAGTIAQSTDNGVGVAGIAPDATILPVQVLSSQGYGDVTAIVNGIIWATDQGADVINMSLGTNYSTNTLESACQYAYDNGVVVVAASGNEYSSSVSYPARYDTVVAVGANRYDGTRAGYSNYGTGMDLVAPGGDLSKDQNSDGYADGILQETFENNQWTYPFWEGTSMASPHVAATAALIIEQGIHDPDQVRDILNSSAIDMGASGYDTSYGYGRLDTLAAVELAVNSSGGSTGDSGDDGSTTGDSGDDGSTTGDSGDDGSTTGDSGDDGSTTEQDTTPPTISSPSAYVNGVHFTIQWTTDEPADSYVVFETYGAYGDDTLTNSHSLSFTGSNGATYYITLRSTDEAGNTAEDGPYSLSL